MILDAIKTERGRQQIAERIVWGRHKHLLPRAVIESTLVSFLELLNTRIQEGQENVHRGNDPKPVCDGGESA
jgi:hypothetical protein